MLKQEIIKILQNNLEQFQNFDLLEIFYDNGQKQLTKVLVNSFRNCFSKVLFKFVNPKEYIFFQVADYLSTLELIKTKFDKKISSSSEIYFFGSYKSFYRNYYKRIKDKELMHRLSQRT